MDANATYDRMLKALQDNDSEEALAASIDLLAWLMKSSTYPSNWLEQPLWTALDELTNDKEDIDPPAGVFYNRVTK